MRSEPGSVKPGEESEELKRILRNAEELAKEIDELPESPRKRELRNDLAVLQAIGDQLTAGLSA